MSRPFLTNANYRIVLHGLLQMHSFSVNGKFDSQEADDLRDAMEAPWLGLSPTEQQRLQGLSADLYSIEGTAGASLPEPPAPDEGQPKQIEATAERERSEWDRALELIRQWSAILAPPLISYFRGKIWEMAGSPEVAVFFLEHAARLEPANTHFEAAFLHALKSARAEEMKKPAEELSSRIGYPTNGST